MAQKVIKVGNSAAITLSQSALDTLGVSIGGEVEIERVRNDASIVVRSYGREKETKEAIVDKELYSWTKNFVETYRKDLEELADK